MSSGGRIGRDNGVLNRCRVEKELIEFLKRIENGPQPAELIILGDAFGLWELTEAPRDGKLEYIAKTHPDLFAQFRETGKQVKIITANLIANAAIEKLTKHIEKINSFENPADLKTYYLEHLETNELSEKGGAGLGFITIGMKSGNKLRTEFEKINEERSLFLLEVTINLE